MIFINSAALSKIRRAAGTCHSVLTKRCVFRRRAKVAVTVMKYHTNLSMDLLAKNYQNRTRFNKVIAKITTRPKGVVGRE